MKVLITKYAVSAGVTVVDGEQCVDTNPGMFQENGPSGAYTAYFHGKDWHTTKESALDHLQNLFAKKRKSLKKQLATLEKKRLKAYADIAAAKLD